MIGVDPKGLLNPSHVSVVFTVSHFGDFPFSNAIVSVVMVIADLCSIVADFLFTSKL